MTHPTVGRSGAFQIRAGASEHCPDMAQVFTDT